MMFSRQIYMKIIIYEWDEKINLKEVPFSHMIKKYIHV